MHICHVFSTFDEGGPQLRTAAIIDRLGDRVSHTIVATDGRYAAASRVADPRWTRIVLPPPGKGTPLYVLAMRRLLREIAPDLVVTYNWGAIDALAAARIPPLCPVIHIEDGFGPDEAAALKRRRVLARRVLLRLVQTIVVPSRTLERIALEQYRVSPTRLALVPNGVDLNRFRPRRDLNGRRSLGIPDDAVVVGTCGALRPEKNLELLLRAFAAVGDPQVWLVIVGDGPCRGLLEQTARTLNIEHRVRFVGRTAEPEHWYATFDVFAMSSITEQMPIALLEAMSCGVPAVCTAVGDTAEILGDHDNLALVPSGTIEDYAAAIRRFAVDPALRARVGRRNRERCAERYGLDRMIAQYAALYGAAASVRSASRAVAAQV